MNEIQTRMIRWSIFSSVLIACVWTIWFIVKGEVPVVTNVPLTEAWRIPLPFGISRWFDILIAPIWTCSFIFVFEKNKIENHTNTFYFGLLCGLGLGIIAGLTDGISMGLTILSIMTLSMGILRIMNVIGRTKQPAND